MKVTASLPPSGKKAEIEDLQSLIAALSEIRAYMLVQAEEHMDLIESVHPNYRDSAHNLIHYLALRAFDMRKLQKRLSQIALSSAGHAEGYALANVSNVLNILQVMHGEKEVSDLLDSLNTYPLTYSTSQELLKKRTRKLFGKLKRKKQPAHIMVTMPSEAAEDYELIKGLLNSGMDIARINLSHDDQQIWHAIVANIRRGMAELNKKCRIYCDLSGPKLRTGPVLEGLNVDPEKAKKKKNREHILLFADDLLRIHADPVPGEDAVRDADGNVLEPAHISISIPSVLDDIRVNDRIWFDDGKIGGRVVEVRPGEAIMQITFVGIKGGKLRAEKGINLPNSILSLPSLTEADKACLPFVAENADIIGYSFVRSAGDVEALQAELAKIGRTDIGLVLKIETREAFDNLPGILFAAMRSPNVGVMIARGDLAVEVGFERISELQDQILWLCEAAQIPTIWATQVLENLAKRGRASRAEITDVAHAVRAECVMLNKGPYIDEAIRVLSDVLTRMSAHQVKRKGTLRPLNVAKRFLEAT